MEKNPHFFIIGSNLKYFRELKGGEITQDQLAEALGVSRQTINSWEGKNKIKLSADTVQALAERLGVSVKDLTEVKTKLKPPGGQVPEDVYKNLVEANTDYRLIPKIILDKYVIIPLSEVNKEIRGYEIALATKDEMIATLREEIREIKTLFSQTLSTKKA